MKMKNKIIAPFIALMALLTFSSCDKDLEVEEEDYMENFEMLWKTVDEKYCFFDYKKDSIKDWNTVYYEYKAKVENCRSKMDLFYILGDMLKELKDGHVNLYSSFDIARYDIQGDYLDNYNSKVISSDRYLGRDYKIAGGLKYKILENNIGYIRYSSFSSSFSDANLDYILDYFRNTEGIVIDVRDNGGGYADLVNVLASRFTDRKVHVGYMQYKSGKGHSDLSDPEPIYLEPGDGLHYYGRVAVLTNRNCYSATNDFVQTMMVLPNVITVGDRTGGGAGMPMSSELPNDWYMRMSVAPYLDVNMHYTEFGIDPDVKVDMDEKDELNKIDTIIETACALILNASF